MSKHTPGPWFINGPWNVYSDNDRFRNTGDGCVANIVHGRGVTADEREANGNLIAAAPELLAALEECITDDGARCMTDESRNAASLCRRRLDAISKLARAAIAKAKGDA